jgi:hypothetical protein
MWTSFRPLQDLKPLNIMKVGEDWKLIDLDAAAKIGDNAGLTSSTGYVPPGTCTWRSAEFSLDIIVLQS